MSMIIVVQSQQWTGTFTSDSTCNRTLCCCLNGQIVITRPSTSMLAVSAGLIGQCDSLATFTSNASYPDGYWAYLTVFTVNLTLTLSSDSNTIHAYNPINSACNGNAYRNIAIKQFGNTMVMIVLIFVFSFNP